MTDSKSDETPFAWLQRWSFGAQLAALLAVLVAVLVLSVTTLITSMMRGQIERDKGAALASVGRSVATALGQNFMDRMQQVELLAGADEVWDDGLSSPKVAAALARLKASNLAPTWAGIADASGTVVAATDGLLVGRSVAERPWFPGGFQGRYVGDVHEAKLLASLLPARPTKEPVRFIDFATPLKLAGRTAGVVAVHADVAGIRAVAERFIPKNAEARRVEVYILTRAGQVIFGADKSAEINVAELAQVLAALPTLPATEQAQPAVPFDWGDGHRYLTAASQLDEYAPELALGWQVLVRQPVDVAYAPAVQAANRAITLGLVIAGVAVLVGLLLGRQLTRPLRAIARAARAVEHDAPGAFIPYVDHNREFKHLSSALQAMTGHLGTLVAERTSQLHAANLELRAVGEEQAAMLDAELVGISRIDMRTHTALWSNRAIAKMFGYSVDELLNQPARKLYADDETYQRVISEASVAFLAGCDYITKIPMLRKDGSVIWIHLQGSPLKERPGESLWMLTDVTAQHAYQEQVEHIAFHDALTGLPNRLLLADRVSLAVAAAVRNGHLCAVAFVDLDGFKAVNDTHGHAAGDHLLKEVARRASSAVRAGDTVARLGGDEFVLVLNGLTGKGQCDAALRRLLEHLEQPVELPGGQVAQVSGSIGVALCPVDGTKPAALLSAADSAMYVAKRAGKRRIHYAGEAQQG